MGDVLMARSGAGDPSMMDLLWTNPSPASNFSAGAVTTYSGNKYSSIGVIIRFSTSNGNLSNMFVIPIGEGTLYCQAAVKELMAGRGFSATTTTLSCVNGYFFNAPYTGVSASIGDGPAYGIPYKVFGIV